MRGVMAPSRSTSVILAILSLVALSNAGPLGPLPNATSSDVGLKEGSCVVGDVVYMAGDTFLGSGPCERCACAAGGVTCAPERCQPRPGCKALHRPDHCCPTYQCECEQEGRVYGNGEKLVDPEDPCRVCYCQGGEVVCRRIACFLRDDCQPRHVKGRCCPEYDNCPLRGVTAIPGMIPSVSSISTNDDSAVPTSPKENIKQEITIKEITPVSEIPVITDVKIKEVLLSPSLEVPEYPSSKSPLIPREAIPEKPETNSAELSTKTEEPIVIEMISPLPTKQASKPTETNPETKIAADLQPSKISLSTQDSINSEIYPSFIPMIIATMGVPALTPDNVPAASSTRVAIIEEDDTSSLFDHNPAFPPIPDDLTVIGNHEDDNIHEQNTYSDHMTSVHEVENIASTPPPTESPTTREPAITTVKYIMETTSTTTTKEGIETISTNTNRTPEDSVESSTTFTSTTTTKKDALKDSPMLNIRSAIPTEILDVPSSVQEDITGELDDAAESVTAFEGLLDIITSTTTESVLKIVDETANAPEMSSRDENLPRSTEITDVITQRLTEAPELLTTKAPEVLKTAFVSKSNIATEITSATEFSSLPVETSDQNPHDSSESIQKENNPSTTEAPTSTIEPKVVKYTTPKSIQITTESQPYESPETTEFSTISQTERKALKDEISPRSTEVTGVSFDTTTQKVTEAPELLTTKAPEEMTTAFVSKSNIATEITSATEFSSLPVETSDQNPHDSSESIQKEKIPSTTDAPMITEINTAKLTTEPEIVKITTPKSIQTTTESQPFESSETTEFSIISLLSSESTGDGFEMIEDLPNQTERKASMVYSSKGKKTNVLTDLINLVGDVASISDHTDAPEVLLRTTTSSSFSADSEELLPVNAGYKSKNSNINVNSITEIPLKSKSQVPANKPKVVEIEDEDSESIADPPPPNDKVEPTTRRPIIDNVSDSAPKNGTEQKKDIEIITQSYVPTINRNRPTKVVMKKNNDKPLVESSSEGPSPATDAEVGTTSAAEPSTEGAPPGPAQPGAGTERAPAAAQ